MSTPLKSTAPQPLQDALEEHYQRLVAETQKVQLNAPPSSAGPSSTSVKASSLLPSLSPRSTASTASSDVSPSHSPPSSPFRSPLSKRERHLTSLDDDEVDDGPTSPPLSVSPTLSSASSSSSSASSTHFAPRLPLAARPSRLPPSAPAARVDSLLHLCTVALSSQLDHLPSLRYLPEEVVQSLLYLTIMRSALTPSLCKLFAESRHDSVVEWIEDNIDTSAVFVATTQSCRERF